jgi:hypothetical protein
LFVGTDIQPEELALFQLSSGQVTKPSLGLREIVRGDYTEAPIRNLPGS